MTKKKNITAAVALEIADAAKTTELNLDAMEALIANIDESIIPVEAEVLPETDGHFADRELTEDDLNDLDLKSTVLELQAKVIPDEAPAGMSEEEQEDLAAEMGSGIAPEDEDHAEERAEMPAFHEMLEAVTPEEKELTRAALVTALDGRIEYELLEKANDKITKTLTNLRGALVLGKLPSVFAAVASNPEIFNRTKNEGSRYNVYAIEKVADLCRMLADEGKKFNAINRAIIKSLFNCRAAGVTFDMEMARYAASDKYRISAVYDRLLTRHTVGVSTAPTQASSTMQALVTLGIVEASGQHKNPVYTVIDSPASRKLEEVARSI